MAGLSRFAVATRGLAAIGLLYGVAGCAQPPAPPPGPQAAVLTGPMPAPPPPPPGAPPAVPAAPMIREQQSLVFYDSDVFDLGFADALKGRADQIHVKFAGPTSLNAFPARMNIWLAEVKKSDGNVTVVDPSETTASRGLFGIGIIFDLIDAVNTIKERRAESARLALIHPYDAKIVYDSATGLAREVDFVKRPPPPPAGSDAPASAPAPATPAS